jgi:guanylate kinase
LDRANHSPTEKPLIGVVGPCTAGKSTLIGKLNDCGISARHIAQEHSFAPKMWQKLVDPAILIFLNVSFEVSHLRRKSDRSFAEYEEQLQRLRHAYEHADLIVDTDELTPEEVFEKVMSYLSLNDIICNH